MPTAFTGALEEPRRSPAAAAVSLSGKMIIKKAVVILFLPLPIGL